MNENFCFLLLIRCLNQIFAKEIERKFGKLVSLFLVTALQLSARFLGQLPIEKVEQVKKKNNPTEINERRPSETLLIFSQTHYIANLANLSWSSILTHGCQSI